MRLSPIVSRLIPFILTLSLGVVVATLLKGDSDRNPGKSAKVIELHGDGYGSGCGECGPFPEWTPKFARPGTNPFQITSKPQAAYTDEARVKEVEGTVRLKVYLLASGNVGGIQVVEGLPAGLTEQAVAAALQIKFIPATVDGRPVSKALTIDYRFDIY